ncbi:MAG: RecQ family ATP-dependent DNA helicase [Bacteroidales bacterium]
MSTAYDSYYLKDALKRFFGFNHFIGHQEGIIRHTLEGNNSFVLMPTGAGKSLCYQLPALLMEGTAVIISPLIALMKNQVDSMRNFVLEDGVAHFLNSSLNKMAIQQVKADVIAGRTKMLYVAPESLSKDENIEFLQQIKISFYAIDEAHCISEWGHDFRTEYRRIRPLVAELGDAPIIALTATATPKVQHDIQKNLGMLDATVFKSSFNRSNLYYEIRNKANEIKELVKYIQDHSGKSGIVYCLSRKRVEELAGLLTINGVKALPYHAGMDAASRSSNQDKFLMQEVDVMVATIAFGMGIDKPDVRFVVHFDMPKSLEGYYQETGRAGRDHGEGHCLAFYSYKDIKKLEKFMHGKSIAEQEVGKQLLLETVSFAESGVCRRKFLLHYFGEEYNEENCGNCDNCLNPKEYFEGMPYISLILNTILAVREKFKSDYIIDILRGVASTIIKSYHHNTLPIFGSGKEKDIFFWNAVIRQCLIHQLVKKDIELYGVLILTDKGRAFLQNSYSIPLVENHEYTHDKSDSNTILRVSDKSALGIVDSELYGLLKGLLLKEAQKHGLPPFVIFSEVSLQDMAVQYPISIEELHKFCYGIGVGKANKFGAPFVKLIAQYTKEKKIERPQDLVIKSNINRSESKVSIIKNIDRRVNFEDIAAARNISLSEILTEIERIVECGAKLNISYYIDQEIEKEKQDTILDYFKNEAKTDKIEEALEVLASEEFNEIEVRLMRIKFISETGN